MTRNTLIVTFPAHNMGYTKKLELRNQLIQEFTKKSTLINDIDRCFTKDDMEGGLDLIVIADSSHNSNFRYEIITAKGIAPNQVKDLTFEISEILKQSNYVISKVNDSSDEISNKSNHIVSLLGASHRGFDLKSTNLNIHINSQSDIYNSIELLKNLLPNYKD
jgi:hypothetical protein